MDCLPVAQHRHSSPGRLLKHVDMSDMGLGRGLHRPAAAAQALEELRRSDTQDSIPMRRVRAHEVNPHLAHPPRAGCRSSITIIKGIDAIKSQECSLVLGDVPPPRPQAG